MSETSAAQIRRAREQSCYAGAPEVPVPGGKQDQGFGEIRGSNLAPVFQLEPAVVRIGLPSGRVTQRSWVGGCQ